MEGGVISQAQRKLDTKGAAEYIGLSASFLNKKRITGGGPKYIKLGNRVIYDVKDLEAWISANRRSSTSDMSSGCHAYV